MSLEATKTIPPLEMVELGDASFRMGADGPECVAGDGEGPVREVEIGAFAIDPYAVSNSRFATFVEATGHVTDAERYGWSFVFGGLLPDEFPDTRGAVQAPWWRQVAGAFWRRPEGPRSSIEDRLDHPVVHVSWRDADVLPLERDETPDRGRVGVRGSRWPRWEALPLGRRAGAGRGAPDERLAGHLPFREHPWRRLPRHLSRRRLPRQWSRAPQHHRQRLGMVR